MNVLDKFIESVQYTVPYIESVQHTIHTTVMNLLKTLYRYIESFQCAVILY